MNVNMNMSMDIGVKMDMEVDTDQTLGGDFWKSKKQSSTIGKCSIQDAKSKILHFFVHNFLSASALNQIS